MLSHLGLPEEEELAGTVDVSRADVGAENDDDDDEEDSPLRGEDGDTSRDLRFLS